MTTGYWLVVAVGGAIGSMGRAGISVWLPSVGAFPLTTFAVNLLGSFAIGLMWATLSPDRCQRAVECLCDHRGAGRLYDVLQFFP